MMITASMELDALQMQVIRLVADIHDKGYLLSIREVLQSRASAGDGLGEFSDEEMVAIREGIEDGEAGQVFTHEDVQDAMRAKIHRK